MIWTLDRVPITEQERLALRRFILTARRHPATARDPFLQWIVRLNAALDEAHPYSSPEGTE